MATSAAEIIVEMLVAAGIKRVYGLPGDSLNGLTDQIRVHSGIEWIHVRHEEVAAFAAGAEAHLTGDLVVCAGSCGPGNLHLINGLYDCHRSRVPVLAIAAQVPSSELGTGYFQETHPETLFRECSHYCELISDPERVPRILAIAMRTAVAQRGVSVIVIPGDVLVSECSTPMQRVNASPSLSLIRPAQPLLEDAAKLLKEGRKITILGGAGCADAHDEVIKLAEILQAPIVHALRGKEFLEYDNPYDVGLTGLLGLSSAYHAVMNCDVLLMLGTDFPYPQFYPEKARVIQVDVRGEQIGKRTHVDVALQGTVRDSVAALFPLLDRKTDRTHLRTSIEQYRKVRLDLEELAVDKEGHTPIHPQYVASLIDQLAADDAIFTCDVGTPTIWAARYLRFNGKRRLVGSFNHGSMANALPQAIGAQTANPQRQVVTLSGDGGIAMLLGDLLTLKQEKLPVKIVVFNNGSLSFVEMEMKAAGILSFGTDLENPSFAKLAEVCGMRGIRVEHPGEVSAALKDAFLHDGPALVDIVVNRQELSMPPSIDTSQVKGFGLYVVRAVMNGRADELVEIASSNVLR